MHKIVKAHKSFYLKFHLPIYFVLIGTAIEFTSYYLNLSKIAVLTLCLPVSSC